MKWKKLDCEYRVKLNTAKMSYYKKEIASLKKSDPKKWFYWVKRLVSNDQSKKQEVFVEDINHLTKERQAELIADSFAKISQDYEKLKKTDIKIPFFRLEDIPVISVKSVEKYSTELKLNKATTKEDIPTKILKTFASHLSQPTTILINTCIRNGVWPDIFKHEIVTPVPKVFPPKSVDDLRNISGLITLNKIAEKAIGELMISDMKEKMDPSQYANQKGIGINHYLIQMLDRILVA